MAGVFSFGNFGSYRTNSDSTNTKQVRNFNLILTDNHTSLFAIFPHYPPKLWRRWNFPPFQNSISALSPLFFLTNTNQ